MSASSCSNRVLLFAAAISLLILLCRHRKCATTALRCNSRNYKLVLTPDLKAATFAGHEEITVKLAKPLDAITLNALELKFLKVTTEVRYALPATVSLDDKKQQATLTFPRTLSAGTHTITIDFTGVLNGQLRGFYLSKTSSETMPSRNLSQPMLAAPFHVLTSPAYKATFDISSGRRQRAIPPSPIRNRFRHPGPSPGQAHSYASLIRRKCRPIWWCSWWEISNAIRPERRRSHPRLRHTGQGKARQICRHRCGIHPPLLQQILRHQVPNAQAGHDRCP